MRRKLATWLLAQGAGEGTGKLPWLFKMGSQLLIDNKFPLHIYLELSRSCNYQCKMCVRRKEDNGYMPLSLVSKVVEEAAHYGPTSFSLHLYGEPLLSPNLESAIKIIKGVDKHNVILLTTNGSLLNPELSTILVREGVDVVYVSIPSLDVLEYADMTGCKGILGDVAEQMINLLDIRKDSHKPKVIARVFEEVGQGGSMIVPLCDEMQFRDYHNFGGNNTKYTQYNFINRYPCYHPWFTLAVKYSGEVNVCCNDYYSQIILGNAYHSPLAKMWQSKEILTLRALHRKQTIPQWHKCSKCDVWNTKPDIFFRWQKG